ncbi:Tat pathway signal protein [Malaciobacter molluscorum LMG 25693]|uniref:Formate dehydrogenase-associated protein n=1 Tax=Malaciobacter molluscorum LMG 25693 TaxID=870501 RepID=A0A2G1DL28_9BACT|nr:Tat pathway signal protein [Malaciobacter molluscorum]AXX91969.1 putative formate dehydrogenase-associated protein [Malaciobacter molluscorum LMG 25693]PHO19202.1 Tat pathway signal protein [Malaciobacter molluscorum LMG 25693]RXJ96520.1 Tat pathway signal protein [Malaciobacter molluscorum]
MQEDRRQFVKKSAMVVGASVAVGATTLAASGKSYEADSNGVVVGESTKKEIIYKKTKAWEEYYKQAK